MRRRCPAEAERYVSRIVLCGGEQGETDGHRRRVPTPVEEDLRGPREQHGNGRHGPGGGRAQRSLENGGEAGPEDEIRRGGSQQTGARESQRRQQRNERGEPARIRTGLDARPRHRQRMAALLDATRRGPKTVLDSLSLSPKWGQAFLIALSESVAVII